MAKFVFDCVLYVEGGYKLFGLAQNFAINKKSTIVVQSL